MAIIEKNDRFYRCRYKLAEFIIMVNNEDLGIKPLNIGDIKIENDYEENIFPLFHVSVILDRDKYYKLIKNKNKIEIKVRIQRYAKDVNTKENSMMYDWINDIFTVFIDDNDVLLDKKIYDQNKDTDKYKKDELRLFDTDNRVDLFLFKKNYVTNSKKIINNIMCCCNLTTAVAWLFYNANMQNILMSPLENKKSYTELILPNLNIYKTIQFLDSQYGFYRNGMLLYFGLTRGYILNYKAGCTAYNNSEWLNSFIVVLNNDNPNNQSTSWMRRGNESNYYTVIKSENVKILNSSVSDNVINGSNINVVDASKQSTTNTQNNLSVNIGNVNTTAVRNDTSNEFFSSMIAAQKGAKGTVLSVVMNDFNIEAIEPNKDFSFLFEDTNAMLKYKGHYRLSSSIIELKKDGEDYAITGVCTFKRVGT